MSKDTVNLASPKRQIKATIEESHVCMLGLGYVGLTLAATLAELNVKVTGIDKNQALLETLRRGQGHFYEKGLDILIKKYLGSNLEVSDAIPSDGRFNVFVISVGTPLEKDNVPNLSYVEYLSGIWSPKTFLRKLERSYPIASWININIPKDAKIFNAEEIRQFYIERDTVRESWFHVRRNYGEGKTPESLIRLLKSQGFTHVLRATPIETESRAAVQGRFDLLDRTLTQRHLAEQLVTMRSANIREGQYDYAVYRLKGSHPHAPSLKSIPGP